MRLLLVSNGHGEDLSGALLAQELQKHGAHVAAIPLVGEGEAYRGAAIPVLGHTRSYSTGGLGYTSFAGRMAELLQGQVLYLLRRSLRLWREAGRADGLVVVGDVIPVLLAWLRGKPVVTYLVAYSSHYEGRLRLPWPCGTCLASRRFRAVFSRDALSASDLTEQLGRPVQFLGNPFMEQLLTASAPEPARAESTANSAANSAADSASGGANLVLLPGSRLPEALENLKLMLQLLEQLPPQASPWPMRAALVRELSAESLRELAQAQGWQWIGQAAEGAAENPTGEYARPTIFKTVRSVRIEKAGLQLELCWGQFNQLLASSQVVVSMAGTATEQAVGLGKPVLQLAGHGPQFTEGFAEAQRRLLGPALFCAPGPAGAPETLRGSAKLLQALMAPIDPQQWQRHQQLWRQEGERRLGTAGGTARLAEAIIGALEARPKPYSK